MSKQTEATGWTHIQVKNNINVTLTDGRMTRVILIHTPLNFVCWSIDMFLIFWSNITNYKSLLGFL